MFVIPSTAYSLRIRALTIHTLSAVYSIIIIMTQSHSHSRIDRITPYLSGNKHILPLISHRQALFIYLIPHPEALFIHSCLELSYGAVDKPSTAEGRTSSLAQNQSM